MSEAEQDIGSPSTVTGDSPNQKVDFVFNHQPFDKGIEHQPGAVLAPHPIIQLTGPVDPRDIYTATASVVKSVDAAGNRLENGDASAPVLGREERSEDGTIKFEWGNLSADVRGWYYVDVKLMHFTGALVNVTMHRSKEFYAGAA